MAESEVDRAAISEILNMKTKITTLMVAGIAAAALLCAADSGSPSNSASDLAALRAQLQQTQAQLNQLTARTSALEQQVHALQLSNAEMQQQLRLQGPQRPYRISPDPNQTPHLVPLQTQ